MYSTFKTITFLFLLIPFGASSNILDSLRLEKINGKKFIIHRVDPKETLYSISKRYDSSIDEIYKYNESIEEGLKMYDEILIPYAKKKRKKKKKAVATVKPNYHLVSQGETLYGISRQYNLSVDSLKAINKLNTNQISLGDTLFLTAPSQEPTVDLEPIQVSIPNIKYHEVKVSETLFGISKLYNVTVDSLTEWNQLESYNLDIGQQLLVSSPNSNVSIPDTLVVEIPIASQKPKSTLDTTYVKTDNRVFRTEYKEVDGKTEVTEDGFAMRIEDTDFTEKFLALHKTAPMGSLVKIKSQMTGIEIQVRVVGALPESGINRNVLLRLSSAAYKKLGALNMKVPVTSTYVKD